MYKILKTKMVSIYFLIIILLGNCCEEVTEPNDAGLPTVTIKLIDVSVQEAYIYLDLENMTGKETVYIGRDNKSISSFTGITKDTILVDTTLREKSSYSYKIVVTRDNKEMAVSNELSITTLERTSHEYEWASYYFGDGSSSYFNDVAIIDENNIWAVGHVSLRDSNGNVEDEFHNVCKWDGENWSIERIYYPYQGKEYIAVLYSIHSFNINDIWVFANQPMRWTGIQWVGYNVATIFNSWIYGAWGSSTTDMYITGSDGLIGHRSSTGWHKLESGTTAQLNDVWGYTNMITGMQEVLVSGGESNSVIKIDNANSVTKEKLNNECFVTSIWSNKGFPIYTAGEGVFQCIGSTKKGLFVKRVM